jgi:hypothetical protein
MWPDELAELARDLERAGGRIEISLADGQPLRVGAEPAAARVVLRSPLAARAAHCGSWCRYRAPFPRAG